MPARQPQPTYTTAGTIYKPSSSQPLQPPARRGRSLKWNSGLPPDLTLLPKSMLSALPLHSHGSTRPAPPVQYSPLQQNYDRAVSPVCESPKQSLDGVAAQTPRLFAASMGLHENGNPPDSSDEDDEESELRMKPLLSMPVKSLHNLASYPNPNQKRAQKVILRGVRSNLAANAGLGLGLCDPNSTAAQGDTALGRPELSPNNTHTTFQTHDLGSASGRRSEQDFQFVNQRQMRASFHRSNTDGSFHDEQLGYTTLASGPGAPRPLTAGPPGQRQYRPSTFDTTFKALRAKEMSSGFTDGANSPRPDLETMSSNMSETGTAPGDHMSTLLGGSTPFDPKDSFKTDYSFRRGTGGSPEWHRTQGQAFTGHQTYGPGHGNGFFEDCCLSPPPSARGAPLLGDQRRDMYGAPEDRLQDRMANVNRAWGSGQQFFDVSTRLEARNSSHGAIGEGWARVSLNSGLDKRFERQIPIEDANAMSAAEHSRPLLEFTLASLERNLAWSHYSKPDPSLIDDTPEGNRSLFGKPQVETKKTVW